MQGSVVSSDGGSFNSKCLGKLRRSSKGIYQLIIGNHVLDGRSETLTKPLAIFEPVGESEKFMGHETLRSSVCQLKGVVREKLIFKSRPNIVVGAMDSEDDQSTGDLNRERLRS